MGQKTDELISPAADGGSDTRARIVDAARDELAQFGFSGARVDRIAKRAETSKERIYFYFKSKIDLAREVQIDQAIRFHNAVPFDPDDIDAFIGDIFDFYYNNRDDVRLWLWFLLEMGDTQIPEDDFRIHSIRQRIGAIEAAQAAGKIDPDWDPLLLLNLISSLAMSRILAPLYVHQASGRATEATKKDTIDRHRAAVVEISHRLLARAPDSPEDREPIPQDDRQN